MLLLLLLLLLVIVVFLRLNSYAPPPPVRGRKNGLPELLRKKSCQLSLTRKDLLLKTSTDVIYTLSRK